MQATRYRPTAEEMSDIVDNNRRALGYGSLLGLLATSVMSRSTSALVRLLILSTRTRRRCAPSATQVLLCKYSGQRPLGPCRHFGSMPVAIRRRVLQPKHQLQLAVLQTQLLGPPGVCSEAALSVTECPAAPTRGADLEVLLPLFSRRPAYQLLP